VLPDVTEYTGTHQSIGYGMGEHVAIGGGRDANRFGYDYSTQFQRGIAIETVGIEAPAHPRSHGRLARGHSSTDSTLGSARSSFLIASSSSTSRLKASSELRVRRALDSMRLRAGLIPFVC